MFRKLRRKIFRFAVVSGAGAAATWFLDPERGVERREQAKDKANSLLKRDGNPVADWQSSTANGFATPPTATSTPSAPASAGGDITGSTPTGLLIVEERAVGE